VIFTICYFGNEIEKDEVGEACMETLEEHKSVDIVKLYLKCGLY
jgi:hypothetical protein